MRISTAYQYDTWNQQIDAASQRMATAENQVATGIRINKASDDPTGFSTMLNATSIQSTLGQYASNITSAQGTLSATDTALGSISDSIKSAYTLALNGANASTDQATRTQLAGQISQLQSRLVQLANTTDQNGSFVFAGQKNNAAPYTVVNSALQFNGDNNDVPVATGPNSVTVISTQSQQIVTDAYNALDSLRQNLLNGNTSAISGTDITAIQNAQKAVDQARGGVGTKVQSLTSLASDNTKRSDDLTTQISNVKEVSYSQAVTNYQSAYNAYQAALTVTSKGQSLSLMDFMK